MGRGRQKAKQQKIARKLKYLTTDTDYDELAKELGAQEPGSGSFDPFSDIESKYADADYAAEETGESVTESEQGYGDDLDEYAKWAAEAAAKASDTGEMPAAGSASGAAGSAAGTDASGEADGASGDADTASRPVPKPHKPIPMPVPGQWKH
ncbi:DUF3073 domain-containing protein [Bifidobacterium choloepi]|uniref:DUF3073 domain-containing protein n=1 Tax=Bifidobacterium choloepi TaxID=2614131 RepID=A0A6I5N1T6_9BIFI|nr:DUF3073 domain-containing protein [Bifidobacterium choloepi]NEG70577.1 DUF3073 domain-containing protein [Bifidobacterium choloepi]